MAIKLFFFFSLFSSLSFSLITKVSTSNDKRQYIAIDEFGFKGGRLELSLFSHGFANSQIGDSKVAFVVIKSDTANADFGSFDICGAQWKFSKVLPISNELSDVKIVFKENAIGEALPPGYYYTFFRNCQEQKLPATFLVELKQYNEELDRLGQAERDYLSIGSSPLPLVYAFLSVIWGILTVLWIVLMCLPMSKNNIIHFLIAGFSIIFMLSIICQTGINWYLSAHGLKGGWSVPYYIFLGTRGILFFIIIALIGSGFAFVKPILTEKEKRFLIVMICLQIFDNVALIVVNETGKGNKNFDSWYFLFRAIDIICCFAVLLPIMWSIKGLTISAMTDGKAALSLRKLRLFRTFYICVIVYIYFRIFMSFVMESILPYTHTWMSILFDELISIVFFSVIGFYFRPTHENASLSMNPYELFDEIELNKEALAEINAQTEREIREQEKVEEGIY